MAEDYTVARSAHLGIEGIAEAVAQEGKRHHDGGDESRRHDDEDRLKRHLGEAAEDHAAPTRRRRLSSDTQEAESDFPRMYEGTPKEMATMIGARVLGRM